MIAVSDVSGGVHDEGGLDVAGAAALRRGARLARRIGPRASAITNEELLELPCDILVLAAREDQVTGENAGRDPGAA